METVGSLIDKLSINELKIYHMQEQEEREDISMDFREDCGKRLKILCQQRDDLRDELQELLNDLDHGKRRYKPFRQLKMYNEKKYKD